MGDKPELSNNVTASKTKPFKAKSKGEKITITPGFATDPPDSVTVNYLPGPKPTRKCEAFDLAKHSNRYLVFLINRNYYLERNPGLVSYLMPYEAELKMLAENLGIKGKENLQKVVDILEIASDRIQDENHDFVILALAVMMAESNWHEAAVSDRDAQGLMQVVPLTAVEIMLKMDDYVLFSIGIRPWDRLYQKLYFIKQIDCQTRRIRPGEEDRATQLKTLILETKEDTAQLLFDRKLLSDPSFNISLGVFFLSYLIQKHKPYKNKQVRDNTLVKALVSYNAGPDSPAFNYVNYALKRSNGKIDSIFFKYLPKKAYSKTWAYLKKVFKYHDLIKNNPSEALKFVKKG